MLDCTALESRTYPPYLPEDRRELESFLRSHGLGWDEDVEFSVALADGGTLLATGSLAGRVIKCLAVDEELRGTGLAARILSTLEAEAATRGISHPFVFTLAKNLELFSAMGYRILGEVPGAVVLLEKGVGIRAWTRSLARRAGEEGQGAAVLVMNCNPITKGHLHLIRTAAEASSRVFVFVVAEEASAFPSEVRLRLVREETAGLANVTVLPGSEYLVSRATFPSYFLQGSSRDMAELHARLDLSVFVRHVVPALGAGYRFVGEEPLCPVTALYNRVMQEELPRHGVSVVEIPRLALDGEPISASRVRAHLREGRLAEALRLVPPATGAYLVSAEAVPVLERLARWDGRH